MIDNDEKDEKDELSKSSTLVNYTKKYSNFILPTIGGLTGFFCLGPLVSLTGLSIGSVVLFSALKTSTAIVGTIGANKFNSVVINKSIWNEIVTSEELNKIKKKNLFNDDINLYFKYLCDNLNDKTSNIYKLYERFETVYKNKHYNNFINNLLLNNYNEIINDTLLCNYCLSNIICFINNVETDYFKIITYQVIEKKFMEIYYDFIYKLISNNIKLKTNIYNSNISYIHNNYGLHECSKFLDVKEIFIYRLDFKFYTDMLNSLSLVKSSSEKLFKIVEIFKVLYNDIELEFKSNNIIINADILVPLISFIIIKSRNSVLTNEIEYINLFSENYMEDDGEYSYILTTIKMAVNIIIDFKSL